MNAYWVSLMTAAWLGILTSLSPCPLATNIAAISFISKDMGSRKRILLSGLLYTLGRLVAYVALAGLIVASVFSVPGVANFLQAHMNRILGPILILAGILLLGIFKMPSFGFQSSGALASRFKKLGPAGSALMGLLFALSFCPVSAALFFGSLIPLSVQHQSVLVMPSLYGIGTALPVVGFAGILAFGANALSRTFNLVSQSEKWLRRVTGAIFVLIGAYYTLVFSFSVI